MFTHSRSVIQRLWKDQMETKLSLPKLIMKRGERHGKKSKPQRKEDRQPLLEANVTDGDIWVELGQKLAQDVLSSVTLQGNPSIPESRPAKDLTAVVKQVVMDSLSQRGVDFGHMQSKVCLEKHLRMVLGGVLGELQRQNPGPGVACVQDAVVDALHCYVFVQLNHTLQCESAQEPLLLIQNVAKVYLSDASMGYLNTANQTSKAVDPVVVADWLQSAQMKYLESATKDIPELLARILRYEEEWRCSSDLRTEEDFIWLQLDVEQLLVGRIQQAEKVSQCLMERVQEICYHELLHFIRRYVKSETGHLKQEQKPDESSRRHQFRTFNTCMTFKKLVQTMARGRADSLVQAITLLENMQTMALELLLEKPLHLTRTSFKMYFKGRDISMEEVMWQVGPHFESLPLKGKEAHKELVDVAHFRISSLYFDCLLLSNRKALERQWDDIGARVRADAICLSSTFSQLSKITQQGSKQCDGHNVDQNPEEPSVTQRNQMLLKVADVLQLTDVEALKVTGHEKLNELSPKQLRALLHWKGGLSKQQVKQVMKTSGDEHHAHGSSESKDRSRFICCC
ncbi:uncharacterized protein si:dkey-196h17.9 isoform X2 [Brienomyrus brachyistius]|uniref:uncharacterized protein si:dkey-196h17.9 isoform X2 n=1 Tax=Brienomyrus brachyistius TaxID=42636 RepID=UPI0020B3DFF9|nr:uncharacterized protein si:dkey-196h17.9 isoform X2 [Brienomyrus brachyistius]